MAEKIEELKKDISELQVLESQATRQKVKDVLSLEMRKLSTEIIKIQDQQKLTATPISTTSTTASATTNRRYQVKLNNYAWDQTAKFVKFYVTLPKAHTLSPENVTCKFTQKSLELNVVDLENKDYIFTINNLLQPVNPETSTWKLKTDMVLINVAKTKDDTWSHVTELEKKVSDQKAQKMKPSSGQMDPNEGIMSIMKNMYEEGDDEMKRTIAKAWSESQNKPGGGMGLPN